MQKTARLLILFLVAVCLPIALVVMWSLAYVSRRHKHQQHCHARFTEGQCAAFEAGRRLAAATHVLHAASSKTLWVIVTACVSAGSNADVRRVQYQHALGAMRDALCDATLCKAFPRRILLVVENGGRRATYLDTLVENLCDESTGLLCEVLYTENERDVATDNKGVRELADLHHALDYARGAGIRDDEWIVKITGRYVIQRPNPVLAALHDNSIDVAVRQGSYQDTHVPVAQRSPHDAVTGLMAMRAHVWQSLFRAYPTFTCGASHEAVDRTPSDPIEWWTARHIHRTVPRERIRTLDRLGCLIAPGSDTFFPI
jgi:hypothetical protein